MEIVEHHKHGALELKISGRLDSLSASHLKDDIDASVRKGSHHIRLNMADVSYMSSAGIRSLLAAHKLINGINGTFTVVSPAEQVLALLELSGLAALFEPGQQAAPRREMSDDGCEEINIGSLSAQLYRLAPARKLKCRLVGDPDKIGKGGWRAGDSVVIPTPGNVFALGVGALGGSFEESRSRFGEFLAIGGTAACLPTDDSRAPDYLLTSGSYVPEVRALYAITGSSEFPDLVRFDAVNKTERGVTMTRLAEAALDISGSNCAAMAVVAESSGLVGAALKRSPALQESNDLFEYPGIRQRLALSAERVHICSSVLVVGIVASDSPVSLCPALRPVNFSGRLNGHFHAAAFPFCAMPHGRIGVDESVGTLFESGVLHGILHLLADEREILGGGESEFARGAMWVGAVEAELK